MSYLKQHGTPRSSRQSEPILGRERDMVENAGGGFVFKVDPLTQLRRFLILGSEGGTYYVGEREHTRKNVSGVAAAIDKLGIEAVDEIVAISDAGRAPKNDEALFALAMAAGYGTPGPNGELTEKQLEIRRAALNAIPKVARTGTHLFQFIGFLEEFRGWGRAAKKAVAAWYLEQPVDKIAYQAVKYRARHDWTHRDVLRLCKPGSESGQEIEPVRDALFRWVVGVTEAVDHAIDTGDEQPRGHHRSVSLAEAYRMRSGGADDVIAEEFNDEPLSAIEAFEAAQGAATPADTVKLIEQYGSTLPREALKTEHASTKEVAAALIGAGMPMRGLVWNLANYTRYGALEPMGDLTKVVADRLADPEQVRRSRLHPVTVLNAMLTYAAGVGMRGQRWSPITRIIDALDEAFYLAFENVEKSDRRTMHALDVSGSMWGQGDPLFGNSRFGGFPNCRGMEKVPPRLAATAMIMASLRNDRDALVTAFSAGHGYARHNAPLQGIEPINISARQRLDDALKAVGDIYAGGTDCALPILYALREKITIDTFAIYTDNESWAGPVHTTAALERYRREVNANAKLVVCAMTATNYSIADPADGGMLDVVGFDASAPRLIADFGAGKL